jgi:hypothetical protein
MKRIVGWTAGTTVALVGLHTALAVFTSSLDLSVHAQQAPAAPATGSVAVANPHYVSIPMEITVNKPVADVWKRVGKYCDIGEWLPQLACTMQSGKDGEFGAVRSLAGGRILEILVAKTEYSYSYAQPVRDGQPYNMYHGTLEARAITPTTTKLVYTLLLDNSMLADDAARERDVQQRRTNFTRALENMKILAEGGTLPPQPARGAAPGGGAPAGGRGN